MATQRPSQRSCTEPTIVGLAGHIGSGKTTAGMYLAQKYGFQYVRYSQVLKEWISDSSSHRDRLQGFGLDVMLGGLQAELNAHLISRIDASKNAAIDGLRHSIDFECLTSTFGPSFEMIYLEAQRENRFERKKMSFSTLAAFNLADTHPVEAHIDDLRPRARVTIQNDDSLERLYQRLDALVTTRKAGDRL